MGVSLLLTGGVDLDLFVSEPSTSKKVVCPEPLRHTLRSRQIRVLDIGDLIGFRRQLSVDIRRMRTIVRTEIGRKKSILLN